MNKEDENLFREFNWKASSPAFRWSLLIGFALIVVIILLSTISAEKDNIGLMMSLVVLILINATPALYKFLYIANNYNNNIVEDNINIEEIVLKFLMSWFSVIFAMVLLITRIENKIVMVIFTIVVASIIIVFTFYILFKYFRVFSEIIQVTFMTLVEALSIIYKNIFNFIKAVLDILIILLKLIYDSIFKFLNNKKK